MRISLIFIILISLNSQLNSQNLDIEILRAINSPEDLPSDDFFRFISNSEPYIMFAVPAGMATAGYIKHDKTLIRNACAGLAAIAVNGGITLVLKYSVNRDRPFVTYPDITQKSKAGLSFVSFRPYFKCFCNCNISQPGLSEMVHHCPFLCLGRNSGIFQDAPWSSLSV